MITSKDFSEQTLSVYEDAKKGVISVFDFATRLLNSDFDKKEVKEFCKKEFGRFHATTVENAFKSL